MIDYNIIEKDLIDFKPSGKSKNSVIKDNKLLMATSQTSVQLVLKISDNIESPSLLLTKKECL